MWYFGADDDDDPEDAIDAETGDDDELHNVPSKEQKEKDGALSGVATAIITKEPSTPVSVAPLAKSAAETNSSVGGGRGRLSAEQLHRDRRALSHFLHSHKCYDLMPGNLSHPCAAPSPNVAFF